MINENWARWIYSSVINHFEESPYFVEWNVYLEDQATYDAQGIIPMYIEGTDFDSKDVKDYIEVRVDGPDFVEISNNYYRAMSDVNVLLSTTKDADIYKAQTLAGRIHKTLSTIPIYRYGNGTGDNGTAVGCMRTERNNKIETSNWGQPEPTIKQTQQTIESHYIMELKGE